MGTARNVASIALSVARLMTVSDVMLQINAHAFRVVNLVRFPAQGKTSLARYAKPARVPPPNSTFIAGYRALEDLLPSRIPRPRDMPTQGFAPRPRPRGNGLKTLL